VDSLSYKTLSLTPETIKKEWVVIDATDQVLGRLCSKVAKILRGKYKPGFTPNLDCGDNVIIVNADKVVMTADKFNTREYLRYTGYPGGQRGEVQAEDHQARQAPPLHQGGEGHASERPPRRPAAQQHVCLQFGRASLPGR
jgi:ribosomal protein L13